MKHSSRDFPDAKPLRTDQAGEANSGRRRDPDRICAQGAQFLQIYLKARRERDWHFPKGLFSDPAWDILLELYVAQSENRPIYEFLIGPAIGIPEKSGLRWLNILETRKLVVRPDAASDDEEAQILLTPNAIAGLNRWLDRLAPLETGNPEQG